MNAVKIRGKQKRSFSVIIPLLVVVEKANVQVVVLNLQPVKAIDYTKFNALGNRTKMTGE